MFKRFIGLILVLIMISAAANSVHAIPPDLSFDAWLMIQYHHSSYGAVAIVRANGSGYTDLNEVVANMVETPPSVGWVWTSEGTLGMILSNDWRKVDRAPLPEWSTITTLTASDGTVLDIANDFESDIAYPSGTNHVEQHASAAYVSPNERWLVTQVTTSEEDVNIMLYDNLGTSTESTLLTITREYQYQYTGMTSEASWAPDNRRFVVEISAVYENPTVQIIDIQDATIDMNYQPRVLTPETQKSTQPLWSSDGKWIAYICNTGGLDSGLCVIEPDGEAVQYLVFSDMSGIQTFSWSPDGQQLAWSDQNGTIHLVQSDCLPDGCSSDDVVSFEISDASRWDQRNNTEAYFPSPQLRWHSNNRHLAYQCFRQETGAQLCMIDTETEHIWQVTDQDCGYYESGQRGLCVFNFVSWQPN